LGQYKDKNNYYHSFKTLFGGRPEVKIRSKVVLTIDLYQHKDIYMIIIIVLKPYSRLTQSKAQATSRDGQLGLIQNKIRIKMIIIIVLKTGSVIDLE
jgi:hypothetical protein